MTKNSRPSSAAVLPALLLLFVPSAGAKPAKNEPNKLSRVAACLDIKEDAPRLACFDREATTLRTAVADKSVVVVEQAEIHKARRSLFGIAIPDIKVFDQGAGPDKEMTAVIRPIGQGEGGRIVFTLEDGAVWTQTDDWPIFSAVKAGQKVTIKRGALTSYFARFERGVPVRAKRLR